MDWQRLLLASTYTTSKYENINGQDYSKSNNTLHSQIPPPRPRRHLSRPPSSLAAGPDAGPAAGQGRLSGGRGAGRRLQHLRPRSARREAARHVVLSVRAGQEEVRDLSKCYRNVWEWEGVQGRSPAAVKGKCPSHLARIEMGVAHLFVAEL